MGILLMSYQGALETIHEVQKWKSSKFKWLKEKTTGEIERVSSYPGDCSLSFFEQLMSIIA